MRLIDIHSHLLHPTPAVFRINNILSPDSIPGQVKIPGNYSIGIHPCYIDVPNLQNHITLLENYAGQKNVLAIGESGLDHLSNIPSTQQEIVFRTMIELSERVHKPLIVHCVKAHAELIKIHQSTKPKQPWIIHGFNQRKTISDLINHENLLLSFGAAIMNEKSEAAKLLMKMSPGTFFLETDTSDISIQLIYEKAAELLSCTLIELTTAVNQLFERTFHHD